MDVCDEIIQSLWIGDKIQQWKRVSLHSNIGFDHRFYLVIQYSKVFRLNEEHL